jgi:predicted AAA+ superfamily ATPase
MIKRHIESNILKALSDTPVVLLNGARQTGKSTLVQSLCQNKLKTQYITLDDSTVLASADKDPTGFIRQIEGTVIIDEIQRAPGLFDAIKVEVDRHRTAGRFLLTGSANVLLLPQLSESLAGRMEILTLWPFSRGEIENRKETFIDTLFDDINRIPSCPVTNRKELWEKMSIGGYPEVISRPEQNRREAWFSSYITAILQRDIRDMSHIEGLTALPRLLTLLAARSPSLLNFAELSRSSGIPQSTLKRYLTLLEMTFLVRLLPAWSGNLSKRMVKSPKILTCDSGLMSYLKGFEPSRMDLYPESAGPLIENFVIMELFKQVSWSQTQPQLYHFRSQAGQEVDLFLEDRRGRVAAIEIKASAQVSSKDFQGIRTAQNMLQDKWICGVVLYMGTEKVSFGDNLIALPVESLWA